jgi:hypothetical protein
MNTTTDLLKKNREIYMSMENAHYAEIWETDWESRLLCKVKRADREKMTLKRRRTRSLVRQTQTQSEVQKS